MADASEEGVLFSLHLKATMMKVSDPIIFGHARARLLRGPLRRRTRATFARSGVDPNNGLGDLLAKVRRRSRTQSGRHDRGRHPGDVRPTAPPSPWSTPAGDHQPARPERRDRRRLHAAHDPRLRPDVERRGDACRTPRPSSPIPPTPGVFDAVVRDCQAHGQFDPATMGSVANVGLMAQKAEEYGSHDKTFEIAPGRNGPGGGRERRDARWSTPSSGRHLARLPDQGRRRPRLGEAGRDARPRHRLPAVFWLDRPAPTMPRSSGRWKPT